MSSQACKLHKITNFETFKPGFIKGILASKWGIFGAENHINSISIQYQDLFGAENPPFDVISA